MPIHDWKCLTCNEVIMDHYQARLEAEAPVCSSFHNMERMWTTNRMHRTFEKFEFVEGNERIEIDSLSKLRDVERVSEQAYKEGRGRPFVWRQFSQDNSNMDRNVFGENLHPVIKERNGRSNRERIQIRRNKG